MQECINTRMTLHFGASNVKKHNLLVDFDEMKQEYQNYEKWHPMSRVQSEYATGVEDSKINQVIDLLHKKRSANSARYDFN